MTQYLDYAITLTVLSAHRVSPHAFLTKKVYQDLTMREQDEYLKFLVDTSIRCSKNYDDKDLKQFATYEFETHPNIKLKSGEFKRHLHGVFYKMTKDDIATIKEYLVKLLKIGHSEKHINNCIKIVPIYYDKGWTNYVKKDQHLRELELDLEDLLVLTKVSDYDVL